ncbi:MAG: hypothetical protein E7667_02710 [Ruminococcaceae bacterium]|nr:hypothetical protein [Oscillospiraceae bacterium]
MRDKKMATDAAKSGKSAIKPPYRKIFDADNNVIGGVSKNSICDAGGKAIAVHSGVDAEPNPKGKGKDTKIDVYQSEQGEYRVKKGEVYLNGVHIGGVNGAWIMPFSLLSTASGIAALALATMLVIRPWIPSSKKPIIEVGDSSGPWVETVEMLPETIGPGQTGGHEFTLTNPHDDAMRYSFDIKEVHNGEITEDFPIEFRMTKNGQPLSKNWYKASELKDYTFTVHPQDELQCGIQWRWKMYGDEEKDILDTMYGTDGGTYALDIMIYNEAVVY